MIFAAFGNVCGCPRALQAVLESCHHEGIQVFVNTGDSAVGGPEPGAAIGLLQRHRVLSVQGERDRLLVRFLRKEASLRKRLAPAEFDALRAAYAACTSEQLEYLRSLPKSRSLELEGVSIALCHGTPSSQSEFLRAGDPPERFRRQRETVPAEIIVVGHEVEPYQREVDGTLFVNPGSVGNTPDDRAHLALISTEQRPFSAELRAVEFDSAC